MYSLLIFIPGFGIPKYDFKIRLLLNNLNKINGYNWTKIDMIICKYDNSDTEYLKSCIENKVNNLKIIEEKGYFGEFMIRHLKPNLVLNYDYVLIMLDDIELKDFNMNEVLEYQQKYKLDIISPGLTLDSIGGTPQMFINNMEYKLRVGPVCELFFYFMPCRSYDVYYDHLDERNPWLWGLDILLNKILSFNCGILNKITMRHHLKNTNNQSGDGEKGYWITLNKYGYKTDKELLEQKLVFYYVL